MKNRYARRSRISEKKIREIVRYFAADLTAIQAAQPSGLNRNTVNRYYRALRERILWACEAQRPMFGIIEVDESFFGARRVKDKRGRGGLWQNRRVRRLRARWEGLYRDRARLLKANPARDYSRPGRSCIGDKLGWLTRL